MRRLFVVLLAAALGAAICVTGATAFGHGLRQDFFHNFTQFNHGAYGGTPRPVIEGQYKYVAEMEANTENWMNGATGYRACIDFARAALSKMMRTPPNDTVLTDNATGALNVILRNFMPPLGPDEWIVDLSTAYGPFANLYKWLGSTLGVQTLTVPIAFPVVGPSSFLDPVAAMLAANASSLNIRVAVISHISAYPSVVLPVKELVDLFHKYGIPVVIDGAHALGNIDVDVSALGDPEYYFANLHKWMFGPKSSAVLYVKRDRQQRFVPAPTAVDNTEDGDFVSRFVWEGTRDRSAWCAIRDALDYRAAIGGEAAIQQYTQRLAHDGGRLLQAMWRTEFMAPASMWSSMALVRAPTDNATACGVLRGRLWREHAIMMSGQDATAPCYFRMSAQVYLDISDWERVGNLTMDILGQLGALDAVGPRNEPR